MRVWVGVIFQGRGFESHRLHSSILLSAQARQVRVKDFRRRNHESLSTATLSTSDPEVWGSIPTGCAFRSFGFSYLLFAFRRKVAHLTWSRSFGAVGEYSNSPLFSPFGSRVRCGAGWASDASQACSMLLSSRQDESKGC